MKEICVVSNVPLTQKIGEVSFNLREGDYVKKLLLKSGIHDGAFCFAKWDDTLENRLQNANFHVIISLGAIPTGLLLKLPKSFKMKDYLGKNFVLGNKILIPWYAANHLLIRGKKLEEETLTLFKKISNIIEG